MAALAPTVAICGVAAAQGGAGKCSLSVSHDPEANDTLKTSHSVKDVFLDHVGSKSGFSGILKLHMLSHYTSSIHSLGSTDGFSTECLERLHIDYAKEGY